jgi:peptide deformylase
MKILTIGNPVLECKSKTVKNITGSLVSQIDRMFGLLHERKGVGLAAPQVNISQTFFVIEIRDDDLRLVMINPRILSILNKTETKEEGCLSVPGIYGPVTRSFGVVAEYLDLDGNLQTLKARGLLARVIQHEYDHLEGKLFIHKLSADYLEKISSELEGLKKTKSRADR